MLLPASAIAGADQCDTVVVPVCTGVGADQTRGQFHGLIMVAGQPDVLATAARSGTQPGCGDCTWTLILACLGNNPIDPPSEQACVGAGNPLNCRARQASYRL